MAKSSSKDEPINTTGTGNELKFSHESGSETLSDTRMVRYGTVKVGNFDHLATFKIILKIFPNSFLTIFLHENVRVLWYFWDPNLKTRFGSPKYHIFKKMLGGRSYP